MILLDTDIMVDLLRKLPQAVGWFKALGDEEVILPGYVMMELIQGCETKAELRIIKKHLHQTTVAWPSPEDCDLALDLFADLRFSHGIGLLFEISTSNLPVML